MSGQMQEHFSAFARILDNDYHHWGACLLRPWSVVMFGRSKQATLDKGVVGKRPYETQVFSGNLHGLFLFPNY